ncbi:d5477f8a-2a53-4c85-81ca-dfc21b3ec509 [Sclerotinia trifoliorum]|uniref:D5477f8a-2a53-4c85-81ca-dfc21b3ec509 n=1 Tax=Sclerotinia trifoliorum TaxID=28548 RepID=A0A8H2VWW7_9HELO|nr:d5477f8a-2a53-4c85-81ca-dfc21b3ec509 [Sclerotinia trifoliorum]
MAEIYHKVRPEALSPPKSAQPVTADRLLELEEQQRARCNETNGGLRRIKTGCLEIDDYVLCASENELGPGFERGIVVGLSAADGDESVGSRLISLNLIASVLLQHVDLVNAIQNRQIRSGNASKPKVVVIDATGSFNLPLLVKVLRSRLVKMRHEMKSMDDTKINRGDNHNSEADTEIEIQKEVNTMLELVAISRVFDIEGLWEVLGEIGRTGGQHSDDEDQEDSNNNPSPKIKYAEKQAEPPLFKLPDEIGDSEEEDIEMTPPPVKLTTSNTSEAETAPEILVIENMHYLISHLFTHSEKSSAHNLLSLLSRTLHTLTHTQNILTILHNTTISTKINYTKPGALQAPPAIQSIITSTAQKPSLGRIFDDFLDLHIMISKIPKTKADAEVLYGQDENFPEEQVNYCFVFEVLRDECPILGEDRGLERKFGDREQRWGLFEVGNEGMELVDAFRGGAEMVTG